MRFMVPSPFSIALAACICFFAVFVDIVDSAITMSAWGCTGSGFQLTGCARCTGWQSSQPWPGWSGWWYRGDRGHAIGIVGIWSQIITNNANSSGSSRFQLVKELCHQVGQVGQVRVVRFYESDESVRGVGLSLFPSSSSLPLLLASTPRHPRCPRDASG